MTSETEQLCFRNRKNIQTKKRFKKWSYSLEFRLHDLLYNSYTSTLLKLGCFENKIRCLLKQSSVITLFLVFVSFFPLLFHDSNSYLVIVKIMTLNSFICLEWDTSLIKYSWNRQIKTITFSTWDKNQVKKIFFIPLSRPFWTEI